MNQNNAPRPPKWMLKFFNWFCHPDYVEDIEGDLYEKYERYVRMGGSKKANWQFLLEVLLLFRPNLIRPIPFHHLIHPAMLQQNLKIGYRTLLKNKSYSFIKIGGFALGITAFLLISLFVKDELSYDQHYQQGERLYRLLGKNSNPEDPSTGLAFPAQIGQVLNEEFPEIEKAARLIPYDWYLAGNNQFRRADRKQSNYEEGFAYADAGLLDVLEIEMQYGNQMDALSKPNSLVISKKMADKYFPNEDPVGKLIILNEETEKPFTIGGVMKNLPKNGHLQFDFFITLTDVEFWRGEQTNWCCWNYNPYIRLKPETDIAQLEQKLLLIRDNYMIKHMREQKNVYADKMAEFYSLKLQPVRDIHLKSSGFDDIFANSDLKIIQLFAAIAIFILLLACVNFINLFTAKSANRAKEIGVRKVVGSYRSNLIQQFLTESTLYCAISVFIGCILAWMTFPYFNQLAGKSLQLPLTSWWFIPSLIGLTFFIGLVAGTYPSFYLSGFKPIDVLKGKLSRGSKNANLRSFMVVFQFTTSIVLVVSALVVYNQMQFILNKKLGYDKEQLLMIQGVHTLGDKLSLFKEELKKLPSVENLSASNYLPVSGTKRDGNTFWLEGRSKIDNGVGGQAWRVDEDYIATMKMNLLAGRDFYKEGNADSASVIINQKMANALGLKDPIGKKIMNWRNYTVIGLVEDFHFESIKGEIGPLVFFKGDFGSILTTRIQGKDMAQSIAGIKSVWDQLMPNQPIRYTFVDETYAKMYSHVERTGNVFASCAILAILISCMGLFGLSTFMAEQRSKEISIRKILGASTGRLFQLLTANYLKLLLIAMLLGIPFSWYLMNNWLQDFAYQIDMDWWFFVFSAVLVAGIALMTVSKQALKLAFSNPAEVLKNE